MDEVSDLIRQAQAGDVEAYTQLVRRFQQMAVAYAYATLGDFHLAEDAAQEALTQAFFDLPSLQEPLAFPSWLRRIVWKYCDRITRRKQRPLLRLDALRDVTAPTLEPSQLAEQRELRSEIVAAIAVLADHERTAVLLFYIGDYAQTEIAAFLDVPVTTVRKRLQAARKRLRATMITEVQSMLHGQTSTHDHSFADNIAVAITVVKAGDVERLRALLASHPTLALSRSPDGRSLLGHLTDYPANIANGPEFVHALVGAGASVDALALDSDMGETPLQWAVSANDMAVADAPIGAGAAVNGQSGNGRPLAHALFYGQRAAAELLVQRGARLNLEFAAGLGRLDAVERCFGSDGLLTAQAGRHHPPVNLFVPPATPHPQAELREQALVYAAINGRVAVAAFLLERGAAINALPTGFDVRLTPLHWAVVRDQAAMVACLLAHGANVMLRDPQYHATAFDWAIYHGREAIAALLRERGAPA